MSDISGDAWSPQPSHLSWAVPSECGKVLRIATLQPLNCSCLGRNRRESCCSNQTQGIRPE